MRQRQTPFNVTLLNPQSDVFFGLREVNSLTMFDTQTGDFDANGLFSNDIFGRQGDKSRAHTLAFIDLKAEVFHPLYFKELSSLKGLYGDIILGRSYAKWDAKERDFVKASIMDGETGFSFFLRHFKELRFKKNKSRKRTSRIAFIEKFRDIGLMRRQIVIPAAMRDVEYDNDSGRPVEDDINPLYRKLISNANIINPSVEDDLDPSMDRAKATLQQSVNRLYDYIFNIIKGKRGFLMSKVASTKVAGTTRNVISSMETGSIILGDSRQPTIDTIFVGLPQFMSGVRPMLIHAIRTGDFADVFDGDGSNVELVDPKTLERVTVNLKPKTADQWLTRDGIQSKIKSFLEPHIRHEPLKLDGHYLGLIYQDEKVFKFFRDINELPEGFSKDNVRPITYAEFFYVHAQPIEERIAHFATRFPVTEAESIKEGVPKLKTTVEAKELKRLGADWEDTGETYLEFPDTVRKIKFLETQAVHPAGLTSYGADFDGDEFKWLHSC